MANEWIQTSGTSEPSMAVVHRVEAITGTASAVMADDAELTYGELVEESGELAAALTGLGVGPGSVVAVGLPRSAALIVAYLGVLRAGAAYVAVDPAQPAERARTLVGDSGAGVLLTGRGGLDVGTEIATGPLGIRHRRVGPNRPTLVFDSANAPAYVMFTSGSTGRPKGVLVGHAGLANLVGWHGRSFDVAPGTRCSQVAGPGFDAAAWEIWGCLGNGGTLVVAPDAVKTDPAGLRDWLASQRIAVAFVPTALADLMLALEWSDDVALRVLLTGGDRLHRRPRAGLPFTVVNNYGITEATVVCTSAAVAPGGAGSPSIGAAIDGVVLRVCDADLVEVPDGERGELLAGGDCVALGYLDNPELTATAFVTLSDGTGPWYRTGDVVVRRADGEFDYVTRVDDQLQVRGYRVEPGEVAAVLGRQPGVAAAAVIGIGEPPAEPRLVAFWQSDAGSAVDQGRLRSKLAAELPPHMVPEVFVELNALPHNANGKVDRTALLALLPADDFADGGDDDADLEATVARIVAGVLKIGTIGPEENFLLLGGHSLLGAQIVARLADRFDVEVSLRDLFDNPTPRGMAQLVTDELVAQVLALDDATVEELSAGSGR